MRFVKKKGSLEENRRKTLRRKVNALLNIAFLLGITLAFFTFQATMNTMEILFRVDPAVVESLESGQSVVAYVVAPTTAVIPGMKTWKFGDVKIVKTVLESKEEVRQLLAKGVVAIWSDRIFRHPTPSFSVSSTKYDLNRDIKWEVHKRTRTWIGRNVTVAIIDTGIDYTHPDFFDEYGNSIVKVFVSVVFVTAESKEPIWWKIGVNGTLDDLYDFDIALYAQYNETAFLDLNGHGTHVAGIVAGRGNVGKYKGLAPGVSLVVIKAFAKDGTAGMDVVLDALEWLYDHIVDYGVDVVSLSWGANMASDGSDPISVACDEIAERGVFVFASAGNVGNYPTTIMVPAVAKLVYAVGAWDGYLNKVAPFSALGPTVDFRMKPDFLGAGVMVVSCRSQFVDYPDELEVGRYYVALSGTSMATPCVAAVCADFIEYYRYWHGRDPSRSDWERFAQLNGFRLNPFFKDFISGWGIPISP